MLVGHTMRRCPQPEDFGENEHGGYGQDSQPLNNTWDSTKEVTEQFHQLNAGNANDAEPSW